MNQSVTAAVMLICVVMFLNIWTLRQDGFVVDYQNATKEHEMKLEDNYKMGKQFSNLQVENGIATCQSPHGISEPMAGGQFCAHFVSNLLSGLTQPSQCPEKLAFFRNCTPLSRGLFAYGYRCIHHGTPVALKRNLHPARYRYGQDEAVVLCQLAQLRKFGITDSMIGIYDFFSCSKQEVQIFLDGSPHPEHMGPAKAGTLLSLELATKPKVKVCSDVQIFELVHLLLASYVVLRIAISDLWVRHLFIHRAPYHRVYTVGNVSIIFPPNTFTLRLIDASSHEHHYYHSSIHLLRQAGYHMLFNKHELSHREDSMGTLLTNSGKALLKWTKNEPFIRMLPELGLQRLMLHMASLGYEHNPQQPLPSNVRCFTFPQTEEERRAIRENWGKMDSFHWYKAHKYVEPAPT
eukprot:GGOE01003689.1.p1 GENE.GGOE01003689.1~~GGOE01003689.1.p1  ORF type:complete len:406 (+),score=47.79 GGOE01003689.1:67-1284(+)